jgi:hypothetical protein
MAARRFYRIVPGEDAPIISVLSGGSGARVDIAALRESKRDRSDVSFMIDRTVAFSSYPGLEAIFSDGVVKRVRDILEQFGLLRKISRAASSDCMWAYFARDAALFDLERMNVTLFGFGVPSVLRWEAIHFGREFSGCEILRNSVGGARLTGTYYSRDFVERLVSVSTDGFYLEEWSEGELRPKLMSAEFVSYDSPEDIVTMKKRVPKREV